MCSEKLPNSALLRELTLLSPCGATSSPKSLLNTCGYCYYFCGLWDCYCDCCCKTLGWPVLTMLIIWGVSLVILVALAAVLFSVTRSIVLASCIECVLFLTITRLRLLVLIIWLGCAYCICVLFASFAMSDGAMTDVIGFEDCGLEF